MCGKVTPGGVWRPCGARKEEAIYTSSSGSLQATCYWWTAMEQVIYPDVSQSPRMNSSATHTCDWMKGIHMWVSDQKSGAFRLTWVEVGMTKSNLHSWGDGCANYCCWSLPRVRGGESSSIPPKPEEDSTRPPRPIVHDFHHPAQCRRVHGDLPGLPATSAFSNLWTS